MTTQRPFYRFSDADNHVWRILCERQWQQAQRHGSTWWRQGIELLDLRPDRIPDFAQLSDRISSLTGWQLVSTDVQYSDGQDWFQALARREFLITEYIRDMDSLDYTPLPDIFHDAFGHLPYMAHQRYADYLERFAHQALRYSKEERRSLGSLWWYTIEFGLMHEGEDLKALGTGLLSSVEEMRRAFNGEVTLVPYSLTAFEAIDPSPHAFHPTLFIVDSFDQVEQALIDWTTAHPPRELVQS